jgi:adenosylhomocysteinase
VISTRIDWVREHCQLLRDISAEFARTRPFAGLTIGTGIHLEAKTAALLLTLRDGGARVVSTGNLNSTQPDAVSLLRTEGITVVGEATKDAREHDGYLREVLAAEPDLILDNGGDLFARYLEHPYDGLIGGTEETTSGRMRLEPLRGQLRWPTATSTASTRQLASPSGRAVTTPPGVLLFLLFRRRGWLKS